VTDLHFHVADPPRTESFERIHVVLYDGSAPWGSPRVGGPARTSIRRLGVPVSTRAFDLLTLALAATAADTFVNRATQSEVGWQRDMTLHVPLARPGDWDHALPVLQEALCFLTGDRWRFVLRDGGFQPPRPMDPRGGLVQWRRADRVCLFSGGMDSTIGVRDALERGEIPLLVSHPYRLDKAKQERINTTAFPQLPRFAVLANPTCSRDMHPDPTKKNDVTMRGRSMNFLATAAVAASVLAEHREERVPLMVPENGFIAINAPLTSRRMGSLSTRTTHPHFLGLVQHVLDLLGIPADIQNPYEFATKGEMLARWEDDADMPALAADTVSCGKWKRKGTQCGRCVPCLVRRASFHRAGMTDATPPYTYGEPEDILASDDRGDLLALGRAARWTPVELSRAVGASGPLPPDPAIRRDYESVVGRGLAEVRSYLAASNVVV
jgi:hypothetical protein